VVISAELARTLWPGQAAVGRDLFVNMYNGLTARVIGVVADVRLFDARTPPRPALYLSASRYPSTVRDLVIHVAGAPPESIVPALRSTVAQLQPGLPLYAVQTLDDLLDTSLASDRFTMFLLSAFGVVALALAGIGIFGVLSGEISRRRKEIGIRLALGARERGVIVLFLRLALKRAAIGVLVGTAMAVAFARGMATLLFGVTAYDKASLVIVTALVLGVVIVSTVIPTLHTIRIARVAALREG
jgi:putative ABC transport system permease protein